MRNICFRCGGHMLGDTCINCGYYETHPDPHPEVSLMADRQFDRYFEYPSGIIYPGLIKRRTKEQLNAGLPRR